MATLLIAEHDNAGLKDATHKALTAATQMGGDVHVLVAGHKADAAAKEAARPCPACPGCCIAMMRCSNARSPKPCRR
jgi:electron transfer flavoprotein alpha subunit